MSRRGIRLPLRAFCISEDWSFKATYQSDGAWETGQALAEMRSRTRPLSSPAPLAHRVKADSGTEIAPADQVDAYLALDLRDDGKDSQVSSLRMIYRALHRPLELALSINQTAERIIRAEQTVDPATVETLAIESLDGEPLSTVSIRVLSGELALQGFNIERDTNPLLSIDTLAFPGATVSGWAQLNPQTLSRLIEARPYDAVMLAYGTNEAAGDFEPGQYTENLQLALTKLREVLPNVPCLLIGAPDRGSQARMMRPERTGKAERVGKAERAQRMKYAQIHKQLNAIQARVAAQYGCHSWDWQRAMGGTGGAYRWARAKPALMSRDLIHLTVDGYRQSAEGLARRLGWAVLPSLDKTSIASGMKP
jgi:lysophospholipase L1-like esterase